MATITFAYVMTLWTLVKMMTAINQIKTSGTYVFDKYFKSKGEPVLGNTAKLRIRKGASIVLKALAPGADRLVKDNGDIYEITIEIPRFGLSAQILAHEMNQFETLEGEAQVQAVSQKIATLMQEHTDEYATTLEFMSTGALFGKVVDGEGTVLFEFTTDTDPIDYKAKEHIELLDEIDNAISEEIGIVTPYEILAHPLFITRLAAAAKAEGEFGIGGQASWADENGVRVLVYNSKRYIPFRATWKDANGVTQPFIAEAEAVVIPLSSDVFRHVYGRADHTEALKVAPQLFFASTPEPLNKGKGWGFETEMKAIPYCVRPGALIKLKFSA
ncbi:MAG: major capsid protein [Campylobacterales bacterium]|nr:major capsid protein [Campylobacterales bacterium]